MAPLANNPIMSGTLIWSFEHLKHQNLSTGDDFIDGSRIIFLVPFLATRKVVAPLTNDTIMSTRSIRLYTHLDVKIHPIFQILMTEQDVQRSLVPIFATREELKLLANDPIMSGRSIPLFRHFQCQNLSTGYAFIHSSEIFF